MYLVSSVFNGIARRVIIVIVSVTLKLRLCQTCLRCHYSCMSKDDATLGFVSATSQVADRLGGVVIRWQSCPFWTYFRCFSCWSSSATVSATWSHQRSMFCFVTVEIWVCFKTNVFKHVSSCFKTTKWNSLLLIFSANNGAGHAVCSSSSM